MSYQNLEQFNHQNYFNLETFRKNGIGVKTPVWFAQRGKSFYVVTFAGSGKMKRIRNNNQVRIAPCKGNGDLVGEWVEARAQVIHDPQHARDANDLLNKK
jgi:PPOX class probable F420-dependent enzyme